MKIKAILFFLSVFYQFNFSFGQAVDTPKQRIFVVSRNRITNDSIPKSIPKNTNKTPFEIYCDSLILENKFTEILAVCQPYLDNPDYKNMITPYVVCANYFAGDPTLSKVILLNDIQQWRYNEIISKYLTSVHLAWIRYFEDNSNKEPVIDVVLDKYRKEEDCTDQVSGEQLIRFYINGQYIRKLDMAYLNPNKVETDAYKTLKASLHKKFKIEDSLQNEKVYLFYKQHGKLFSKQEIGEFNYSNQRTFLYNFQNLVIRKSFFQPMIEEAVNKGIMNKHDLANFLLRTKNIADPNFFKDLEKHEAEISKELDIDNYFYRPF